MGYYDEYPDNGPGFGGYGAIPPGGFGMGGAGGVPGTPGLGAGGQPAPGMGAYQQGSVPGGQRPPTNAFFPLEDSPTAIYRAIKAMGLNPSAPTWGVNQLLARAEDIVRGVVGRAANAGQESALLGGGFQQMINEAVASGLPISGPEQGRSGLSAINNLINQAVAGTGGEAASLLGALFGKDPSNATKLAESLLYQGLNSKVRSAVGGPLATFPAEFAEFTEDPTGRGAQEAARRSALDMLLNGGIPGYRGFPGR